MHTQAHAYVNTTKTQTDTDRQASRQTEEGVGVGGEGGDANVRLNQGQYSQTAGLHVTMAKSELANGLPVPVTVTCLPCRSSTDPCDCDMPALQVLYRSL